MIKLTIDNKKYSFPERLKIEEWKTLVKYDFTDYSQYPKIISYLIDVPLAKVEQCNEDSQILAVGFIISLMNRRKECKVKEFNDINFGEFVDLDIYIVMGIEKNMEAILKMLTPEGIEPTDWADEAMWAIDQYAQFRVHTYRQYSGLFGLNKNGEQEVDDEELEAWNPQKVAKGWYKIIIDVADDDIQKIDYVTEQPLKKVLNFMANRKEKQLEENFKLMQQKRKYDLSRNRK
jgi:hypothetical protein